MDTAFKLPGHAILQCKAIRLLEDHNHKNFQNWVRFTEEIALHLQKEINDTTYGQAPSYSSFIRLDTVTTGDVTRKKEIGFFVSLLGPYYTVLGLDRNELRINDQLFSSTNYLVASPENEFETAFDFLCRQIEEQYKRYRFVPFAICNKTIEGLKMRDGGRQVRLC